MEMQYVSVDEILLYIGEFGAFQWSLVCILFLLNTVPAYTMLIMTFAAIEPSWRCIANSSICMLNGTYGSSDIRRCGMNRSEWVYVEPPGYSIITQFDFSCNQQWLIQFATSAYFIGYIFGAIILGWVADNYGRRTVIIPSHFVTLCVGFISAFSPNMVVIVISRFVLGFFLPGNYVQMLILLSELVGRKQNVLACQLLTLIYPIGACIMAMKAYYVRQWKLLFILCTAPYIIMVVFYKSVPESIRWLRLHGELEKVSTTVCEIARRNKKVIPENMHISPASKELTECRTSVLDIFRTRKLAIQSAALGYCWFTIGLLYYGIYMAASNLGGSIYRNFMFLALADIPAFPLVIFFCNRLGRKTTFICSTLIGGVAFISIALIPLRHNIRHFPMILATVGKLFILVSNQSIYQWSLEIYPTKVRAVGLGFIEVTARVGSAASPWVANGLHSVSRGTPFIVMGIAAIIATFVAIFLPETKGSATAECIKVDSIVQVSSSIHNHPDTDVQDDMTHNP